MSRHPKPWVSRSNREGWKVCTVFSANFLFLTRKMKKIYRLEVWIFPKMYHWIPLLLGLRLSVQQIQIPLEGLHFVKTFVTVGIIYVTDPLVQNVTNIVCPVDPHHSIFLTITPCSLCFQNQGRFLCALASFFCTSDKSNPLSEHLKKNLSTWKFSRKRLHIWRYACNVNSNINIVELVEF